MYKFISLKDNNSFIPGSKIANLQLFSEHNEVKIQGILRTLFGEPLFESDNYEDAYCYMIEAIDSENSNDLSLHFYVYQGSSGCAIGGLSLSTQMKEAINQFKELLKNTEPSDFMYEGYYMDAFVKIRQGIQNGEIIYEKLDIDEEHTDKEYTYDGYEDDENKDMDKFTSEKEAVSDKKKIRSLILRELTGKEKEELNRMTITDTENGYQVLLSMIAVDLMKEKAYEHQIKYTDFSDYITNDWGPFGEDFMLVPIVESWLTALVMRKEKVLSEKINKTIKTLTFAFIDIVCTQSCGMAGKLHREMIKFYKEMDEKIFKETGLNLINSPELIYRFIVACLEYVGIERKPSEGTVVIDVTGVYYTDL